MTLLYFIAIDAFDITEYPEQFYVKNVGATVQDGDEESVAKCIVKGAKPEPKMWYALEIGISNNDLFERFTLGKFSMIVWVVQA